MELSPLPKQQFFDNNGEPLVGGLLFTYVAGTATKVDTYTDSTGGSLNTNPIVLDYRGECNVWLDITKTYKFVLAPRGDTDPPTKPIWSVDQISVPIGLVDLTQQLIGSILYPQTPSEASALITPSDYAPVLLPDIERYGADTANSAAANTTAIQRAINANYGRAFVVPPGTYNIATTGSTVAPVGDALTITSSITIIFRGILKGTNNCNNIKIAAGSQDVVNLIYEGGGLQGFGTFFELTNSNGALVRISGGILRIYGIKLIDPPQYALYTDSVSDGEVCQAEIIGGQATYPGDNNYGLCLVDNSTGWKIDGNKFSMNALGGRVSQAVASLTFTSGTADRTQIINNRMFGQWEKGTYIFGDDIQINNNWVYNCSITEGIRVIGARPEVVGNVVRTCEGGGITLYDAQGALCSNNDISDYNGAGIQLAYYAAAAGKSLSRACIENNKIKGRTTGTNLIAAIDVRGHASTATIEERIRVRGNEIETANFSTTDERGGIHILPQTVTTVMKQIDVSDNIVAVTGSYGIRFGAGIYTYSKVERNRVTDPGMQHTALGGNRSAYRWDTSMTWVGTHVRENIALSENAGSGMSYGFENVTLASITSTEVTDNMSRGHVTSGYLNMNNATNDLAKNRQGDDGLTGTFTASAAASTAVSNSASRTSMRVILYPLNSTAATLMAGSKMLYFDGTVTAGTNFTVKTADGTAAAGTESFAYELRT